MSKKLKKQQQDLNKRKDILITVIGLLRFQINIQSLKANSNMNNLTKRATDCERTDPN